MTRKSKSIGTLAVLLAAAVILGETWRHLAAAQVPATPQTPPPSGSNEQAPSGALPALWKAPAFSYLDQDGKPVTNALLRGHAWVADFIFTQCTTACPTMTAKMVLLQREIGAPEVRFISFSVDPEHDTPAALKAYAALWHSHDTRWHLLSTDPAGLAKTAAGMKVSILHDDDPEQPIIHSTLFMLVDGDGWMRGVYSSNDPIAMKKLAADALALGGPAMPAGTPAPATQPANMASVQAGQAMFTALGCGACHSQAKLAPPLGGLYNSLVRLDTGQVVRADEAYLVESILYPAAKIVDGYGHTMPSYQNYVTQEQLGQIVDYLKSLPAVGVGTVEAPARKMAVDPVCGMEISVGPDTPHVVYAKHDYYFCSQGCQRVFFLNPRRYAAGGQSPPLSKPSPGSG